MDIIKRDVSKRVARYFPDSNLTGDRAQMRNKIIDCIILGSQKEKELIGIVESSEDLVDLDNYFLPAIFGARSRAASTAKTESLLSFNFSIRGCPKMTSASDIKNPDLFPPPPPINHPPKTVPYFKF